MSGNEKQPDQVLKEILSSSRKKWQELIDDLVSDQRRLKILPPPPKDHSADRRKDVNNHASQESFQPQTGMVGLKKLTSDAPVEPMDTETTFQRDERLHRLTQVMARLAKVEKQNHKVMVLIFALTISAFIFLLIEVDLFPKNGLFHMTQAISMGTSTDTDAKAGSDSGLPIAAPVAGNFVGVKTSHEYHYPDCEATKTVAPQELLTFKSLAAAKREGYKPCPLCQPPSN
ncbi:MAG: hypothetical protein NTY36_17305 [Deltaproteobacteria bacterium]|nr:hypothetical protein [Deltaproteobacteria bacterium]